MAKDTISEVYEATEGIDNDMFGDACELVTVLGKMMRRGLGSSGTLRSKAQEPQVQSATRPSQAPSVPVGSQPGAPPGMI